MNISNNSEIDGSSSARCGIASSMLLIGIVVALMTLISWFVYPQGTDDNWIEMAVQSNIDIRANYRDRPVLGAVFEFIIEHRIQRLVGTIVHWTSWTGMGLMTILLWRMLFPSHRGLALPVACLALAPVLFRAQFYALVFPLNVIAPVALVYAAIFGLLSWPTAARWGILRAIVFLVVAVLPIMLCEYALPVILIGIILLVRCGLQSSGTLRGRYQWTAVALLGLSAVTYFAYWKIADASVRTEVRPEQALSGLASHIRTAPRLLVSAVWEGALGAVLENLGAWNLNTKEAVAATIAGVSLACCVLWMAGRQSPANPSDSDCRRRLWPVLLLLLAFIALGRLPVAWIDRGSPSRYWCPLIPVAACATVAILLLLLNARMRWMIVVACGFLLGYNTVYEGLGRLNEVRRSVRLGKDLQDQIPTDGLTLVILLPHINAPALPGNDFELTEHATKDWPSRKRQNCWIFSNAGLASLCCTSVGGLFGKAPYIAHLNRGIGVEGFVQHILWAQYQPDESCIILNPLQPIVAPSGGAPSANPPKSDD